MKRYTIIATIIAILAMTSCKTPKKVAYLVEADKIPEEQLRQPNSRVVPVLCPGDLLNIKVFAANMASVAQFNKGMTVTSEGNVSSVLNNNTTLSNKAEVSAEYYLVDSNGNIDFPILGLINVTGKTKEQVSEDIRSRIYPKYVTTAPTVEIRLMNFKVTILGAVKNPGVVTSNNERLNILEALALAGDLDIRGERENILLYRTNADGTHEVQRLDLNDRNLLLSPYFNLQQNDFIYVEPNKYAKQNAWQMHPGWSLAISVVGGVSSVASLVIGIINL